MPLFLMSCLPGNFQEGERPINLRSENGPLRSENGPLRRGNSAWKGDRGTSRRFGGGASKGVFQKVLQTSQKLDPIWEFPDRILPEQDSASPKITIAEKSLRLRRFRRKGAAKTGPRCPLPPPQIPCAHPWPSPPPLSWKSPPPWILG